MSLQSGPPQRWDGWRHPVLSPSPCVLLRRGHRRQGQALGSPQDPSPCVGCHGGPLLWPSTCPRPWGRTAFEGAAAWWGPGRRIQDPGFSSALPAHPPQPRLVWPLPPAGASCSAWTRAPAYTEHSVCPRGAPHLLGPGPRSRQGQQRSPTTATDQCITETVCGKQPNPRGSETCTAGLV